MADASRAHPGGVAAPALPPRLLAGAGGGLIGGVLFGLMMGVMGMLPMVAMLVGPENAGVGFVVHMLISAIIGAGFGLIFGSRALEFQSGALWGAVYGVIWWILGPLLVMPIMMVMGPQLGMVPAMPMLMTRLRLRPGSLRADRFLA